MNPVTNPYAPGAGTPPPELAGRDQLRERLGINIQRLRRGRSAKSLLMVGLRGVGKTVLLERMRQDAEAEGIHTLRLEAPEHRSLPALLAPQLRLALLRLSRTQQARALAQRGLSALAGFARALKVKYQDIEVGFDAEPEPGLADNGDLELDLIMLLEEAGKAAREADTALVMFVDELQYVAEEQLAALISALHRCSQLALPVSLVGAGLPQLRGRAGKAKSYAERLFDYPEIGPLDNESATLALVNPAREEGVEFESDAIQAIITASMGYPYFLQEWASHTWDIAAQSPIIKADAESATPEVIAALDANFFMVRFDRITPAGRRYLRAMAELGAGPHRSGEIAAVLGKSVQSLAPIRAALIEDGMLWSPGHGQTAFTVPLFDDFMRRNMPGDDWKSMM
jgi:hypothetical protein